VRLTPRNGEKKTGGSCIWHAACYLEQLIYCVRVSLLKRRPTAFFHHTNVVMVGAVRRRFFLLVNVIARQSQSESGQGGYEMKRQHLLIVGFLVLSFVSQSVAAITDGLIAHYKLDDISGPVLDSAGSFDGAIAHHFRTVAGY